MHLNLRVFKIGFSNTEYKYIIKVDKKKYKHFNLNL